MTTHNKPRSYSLTRLLHLITHWIVAIGRGGFLGISLVDLAFGGFLWRLAEPASLTIRRYSGMAAAISFLMIFTKKDTQDYAKLARFEKKHQKLVAQLKVVVIAASDPQLKTELLKDKSAFIQRILQTHQAKTLNKQPKTWQNFIVRVWFKCYNRSFECLNAGKDFIRGMLLTASLYGLTIPTVMSTAPPLIFGSLCLVSLLLSCCAGIEYHLNKKRDRQIEYLKQSSFLLQSAIQQFTVSYHAFQRNRKVEVFERQLQHILNPAPIPKDKTYVRSAEEKRADRRKLTVAAIFGVINGLYFGFIMHDIFFHTLTTYIVPSYLPIITSLTGGLLWMLQTVSNEYRSQNNFYATQKKYERCFLKWQQHCLACRTIMPSYKSGLDISQPMIHHQTKKWQDYGIDMIEGTRAFSNATKLINFCCQIMAISVATQLGFMGTFGLLPTLVILSFAISTATSSLALSSWNKTRQRQIEATEKCIKWLKRDISYVKCFPIESTTNFTADCQKLPKKSKIQLSQNCSYPGRFFNQSQRKLATVPDRLTTINHRLTSAVPTIKKTLSK